MKEYTAGLTEEDLSFYRAQFFSSGVLFITEVLNFSRQNSQSFDIIDEEYWNIQEAINKCETQECIHLLPEFVIAIGDFFISRGHWKEFQNFACIAIEFCRTHKTYSYMGKVCYNLGRLYFRLGYYEEAEEILKEGLDACSQVDDHQMRATMLYMQSAMSRRRGDYETARYLCEESLRLMHILKDEYGIAVALYNLGAAHDEDTNGDLAKAISAFEEGLQLFRRLNKHTREARTLIRLARALLLEGRIKDAEHRLHQAEIKISKDKEPREFVDLHLIRAKLKEASGNSEAALLIAEEAWLLAERLGMKLEMVELIALMHRCKNSS